MQINGYIQINLNNGNAIKYVSDSVTYNTNNHYTYTSYITQTDAGQIKGDFTSLVTSWTLTTTGLLVFPDISGTTTILERKNYSNAVGQTITSATETYTYITYNRVSVARSAISYIGIVEKIDEQW